MDTKKMSDDFLSNVVNILGLEKNFRFDPSTINTKIDIDSERKSKLKKLCAEDKYARSIINKKRDSNHQMNLNWSYEVLKLYFNLEF